MSKFYEYADGKYVNVDKIIEIEVVDTLKTRLILRDDKILTTIMPADQLVGVLNSDEEKEEKIVAVPVSMNSQFTRL